jgi:hypothetical protein
MQKEAKYPRSFLYGALAGGVTIVAVMFAAFVAGRASVHVASPASDDQESQSERHEWLQQRYLNATSTHGADTMAIATGRIDDNEGLFVLDFLTGELSCFVVNNRTGTFTSGFKTNVLQALGIAPGKKPKYLMVTGGADLPRGVGRNRMAGSIVYVVDSNTGNFAGWAIPYDGNASASGSPQIGQMQYLDAGKARNIALE